MNTCCLAHVKAVKASYTSLVVTFESNYQILAFDVIVIIVRDVTQGISPIVLI